MEAASEAGRVLQAQRQQNDPAPVQDAPVQTSADDGEGKPIVRRNPRREMAFAEIEARQDIPEPTEPEPSSEGEPRRLNAAERLAAQDGEIPVDLVQKPEAAPQAETPTEPPTVEYVKVKVDGEEFDAPKSDVEDAGGVRAYQVQKAAENRLAKANEALAEAKRMQAQFLAQQAATAKPAEPPVSDDEFIAQRLDAIRYGTPAEAAKALGEIQQRSAPPVVDQNALVNDAIVRMSYTNAVRQFDNEFKDLTADPDLMMLVRSRAEQGLRALPQDKTSVDFTDFFRRIGNDVRIRFGKQPQPAPGASTTSTPSPVSSDREARKASIVNLPTAGSRAAPPVEPKPQTREELIAEVRKSRGQRNG